MAPNPSRTSDPKEIARWRHPSSSGSRRSASPTNDLTQLTLGVDRDSAQLAALFDERDAAVRTMVQMAIEGAHAAGIKVGLCGQAPSDYPEFAEFLVEQGIDSISLNPDSFLRTAERVAKIESRAG